MKLVVNNAGRKLFPNERKILKESMDRLSAAFALTNDIREQHALMDAMESIHNAYSDEFEVH